MRRSPALARYFGLLTLIATCGAEQATVAGAGPDIITPVANHHEHIYSPDAFALTTTPPLPIITLPSELARLLRQRSEGVANAASLAEIYTDEATLLDARSGTWLRGRREISSFISKRGGTYRLLPLVYKTNDGAGYISGTFAQISGLSTKHLENFLLAIRKGDDGVWRIEAETSTPQPPRISPEQRTVEELIKGLNATGTRFATVLSSAYFFGTPMLGVKIDNEAARTRLENDWVAKQVSRFPDRLTGFCGFNPLKDYALAELHRCTTLPGMKGIKLHFANSGVDVRKAEHVQQLQRVLRAANERRLAIVAHVWVPGGYGRSQSEIFLNEILPSAPDVPIQIAHLTGTGPGYFDSTDAALTVFSEAIRAKDPRVANLYFDVASNVTAEQSLETRQLIAQRLREIGLDRILFGSDISSDEADAIPSAWQDFLLLPLSLQEFASVAENIAPYLRR